MKTRTITQQTVIQSVSRRKQSKTCMNIQSSISGLPAGQVSTSGKDCVSCPSTRAKPSPFVNSVPSSIPPLALEVSFTSRLLTATPVPTGEEESCDLSFLPLLYNHGSENKTPATDFLWIHDAEQAKKTESLTRWTSHSYEQMWTRFLTARG